MPTFFASDGLKLSYEAVGTGRPLVCLPGGPMRASRYLGDLGGLTAYRRLVLLDLRGTGASETPSDLASCRCDRLVSDVDALRMHLDLAQLDVLGHSAGANIAVLYAARFPERVSRLALIAPSLLAVGVAVTTEDRQNIARLRAGEAWFSAAVAALERIASGAGTTADWKGIAPFFYGRWDEPARLHEGSSDQERNKQAAAEFGAPGAFEPSTTRFELNSFSSPTLVLAGELDMNTPPVRAADMAALLLNAKVLVQKRAGHYPWLDDAKQFVLTVTRFLDNV